MSGTYKIQYSLQCFNYLNFVLEQCEKAIGVGQKFFAAVEAKNKFKYFQVGFQSNRLCGRA